MDPPSHAFHFGRVHVHLLRPVRALGAALAVAGAAAVWYPGVAAGQQRPEARLILSAFGGVAAGSDLWEINRQPLLVLGTELAPRYDTLRLARTITPGLVLGLSGSVFRSPSFGFSAEIVFVGLSTDDQCTMVYQDSGADPLGRNRQICADLNAQGVSPTTVGFFAGAVYRAAPRGFASPFVRLQLGIGARSGSTVETRGAYVEGGQVRQRVLIADPRSLRLLPSAGGAVGVMIPLGTGHQARLELRDQVFLMDRVSGVATDQAVTSINTTLVHSVALTAGIDIVLEQRRGRRY